MFVETLEWLPCVAQQAVFQPLCLTDVIIMEDDEFTLFDHVSILPVDQPVIEKLRFTPGFMDEFARGTGYLEIRPGLVFTSDDEFLTATVQALKSHEHDIAHAMNMGRPLLPFLFDLRVRRSTCHARGSGECLAIRLIPRAGASDLGATGVRPRRRTSRPRYAGGAGV